MTTHQPPRRSGPARSARGPQGRAGTRPHDRSTTRSTEDRTPIPATVWTGQSTPSEGDALAPEWLVEQAVTALSTPGARVALLDDAAAPVVAACEPDSIPDNGHEVGARIWELAHRVEHLGRHADPLPSQRDAQPVGAVAVPYWNALLDSDTDAHLSPSVPEPEGTGAPDGPAVGERLADLVLALVGPQGASDRLGVLAASRLRTGGILAVLTHSDTAEGRLRDPIGSIVASAQNADLLYLQHIIALHATITDGALTIGAPTDTDEPGASHQRVHSDVLIFAQPTEAAL